MSRIVFFGMDGAYSATILRALIAADLRPSLVVVGVERPLRGAIFELSPAEPTFWQRLAGHTGAGRPVAQGVTELVAIARSERIDALKTSEPDLLAVRAELHRVSAEAFVIAGFPCLLSAQVLALASRGALNVHPGALPAERGPSPVFWALKAGRTKLTVTIHLVDEGEDTGDVVSYGLFNFEPGTDGADVLRRAAVVACPMIVKATRALFAGDLVRIKQSTKGVGRCPRPTFRDGLVEPERGAEAVHTFVGGCAAHYSLFAEIAGDRFFIRRSRGYSVGATLPSEFVVSRDMLLLQCKDGVVELELKPEGAIFSSTY